MGGPDQVRVEMCLPVQVCGCGNLWMCGGEDLVTCVDGGYMVGSWVTCVGVGGGIVITCVGVGGGDHMQVKLPL